MHLLAPSEMGMQPRGWSRRSLCSASAWILAQVVLAAPVDDNRLLLACDCRLEVVNAVKIIIAGSRDITDYEVVRNAVIASGYWKEFGRKIEVVSGCANGVDKLGIEFASKNNLTIHRFPADWKTHGKAAGHVRNKEMGDYAKAHGGRLLAVWDGKSTGTKGMVAYADKIGLERVLFARVTDELYRRVE